MGVRIRKLTSIYKNIFEERRFKKDMLKLRILTDVNGVVTDKEGLKRDWIDFFEYLLDESTGKVVKANDFFHKVAIELIH